MNIAFKKKQAGVLLLEVLAGLIILASVITGVAIMINRSSEDTQAAIAAQHLRTVGDAASAYIRNNLPAILGQATDTQPVLITVANLIAANNLPQNFSPTNAYGQQTCVLVLEDEINNPGKVTAMVVTEGGRQLDDAAVNTVANLVGASGGAIRSGGNNFSGSRNSWTVPIGSFSAQNISISTINPLVFGGTQNCDGSANQPVLAAGHPAMALWLANGGINEDVIYRRAIPGRSELNQMNTPLDLVQRNVGDPCLDSNNSTITTGFARDNAGNLLTCKENKWVNVAASSAAVLRKSAGGAAEKPASGGKFKYYFANCDTDNGEKLITGTCSAYCHQFVPIGGGPHIITKFVNNTNIPVAVGWRCSQSPNCSDENAKVACTKAKDPPDRHVNGGKRDTVGILIDTDENSVNECNSSDKGPNPCYACPDPNAASPDGNECTYCPYGSSDGKTCDIKCEFKKASPFRTKDECKICNDTKCAICEDNVRKSDCMALLL